MKKYMVRVFVGIGLLFCLLSANAQSDNHLRLAEMSTKSWPNPFRPSLASQEGTPFLFDEWLQGSINSIKGKTYEVEKMKLNLLHGRLLITLDGEEQPRMVIPIHIRSFSIQASDSLYTFHRHLVPVSEIKNPMDPFFLELASGNYYLLAKPGKQAQRENKNVLAKIDEQHNVKYVDYVDYFIENPSGKILPFKNNKKVKAQIFGNDMAQVEKFAKQNKLRWGKAADLTRIVQAANQM